MKNRKGFFNFYMASGLKLSSAHAHNARSVCRGPATAHEQAWAAQPTTGLAGRRTRPVSARSACSAHLASSALRAHDVAWLTVAHRWPNHGNMYTSRFPSPRCTCLTRLRAPARSEEGGRWRGRTHRRGRWCQSSTAVKVPILQIGEQL
jgi:hypothetical protein